MIGKLFLKGMPDMMPKFRGLVRNLIRSDLIKFFEVHSSKKRKSEQPVHSLLSERRAILSTA